MTNETYDTDTDAKGKERTETERNLTRIVTGVQFQAGLKVVPRLKLAGGMGVGR